MPNVPNDIWVQLGVGGTLLLLGMIVTFGFTIRFVNRHAQSSAQSCTKCKTVEEKHKELKQQVSMLKDDIANVKQEVISSKYDVEVELKQARRDFRDWLVNLTARVDKIEISVASMYSRVEVDTKLNRLEDHVDKLSGGK